MISIVVPNYNSADLLKKNLPRLADLLEKSKLEYEVIVTDDASTDDSIKVVSSFKRGGLLKVISSPVNTGFGSNVDRGVRAAKGEIVFILNAIDILPQSPDYFQLMLAHFDNPKVFSVAAAKRDANGTHGCGEIYFEKGFFLHKKGSFGFAQAFGSEAQARRDKPSSKELIYTAWADGGAQALRREYYLKIGGFDPLYKFYWEDVDLGYRAWKAGYKIHFEPKAVLLHQKHAGPIAKYYTEKQRRIMNLRNQFIFTWKNADLKHLLLYNLWEPYHFAVALKNRDWDWFRSYLQAFSTWPEIIRRRI